MIGRAVCGPKEIIPFEPNKSRYGKNKSKKFLTGMKEILETPSITCGPQLVTSTTISNSPEAPSSLPAESEDGQELEEGPEKLKESTNNKPKPTCNKRGAKGNSNSSNKRRKTNAGGDGKEEQEKEERKKEEQEKEERKKEEETAIIEEHNSPESDQLGEKSRKNEERVVEEKTIDANLKVEEKESMGKRSEMTEKERRMKKEQKAVEKERLKQELKEKKLEKKRKERIEQLKNTEATTSTLTDLDIEIMQSLNVESLDVARCLHAMSKLDLMQVNQKVLIKYPNIMYTIKKCRRFKGDQTIRQKAEYLFNKFKTMFSTALDESAQKLLELTNEASQDSVSSSSPTRESDPPKTATQDPLAADTPEVTNTDPEPSLPAKSDEESSENKVQVNEEPGQKGSSGEETPRDSNGNASYSWMYHSEGTVWMYHSEGHSLDVSFRGMGVVEEKR